MRYRIAHSVDTDLDTFWDKIFFDDAYNQALFAGHLGFTSFEVRSFDKSPDGTIRRTVYAQPPVTLPPAVQKVIGELSGYTEVGVYNPTTRRYTVDVTPTTAADKIKTRVEIWAEPRGDKKVERFADIENQVKIFGVGKIAEKFIEQQMRSTYEAAAVFTNRWIAEQNL